MKLNISLFLICLTVFIGGLKGQVSDSIVFISALWERDTLMPKVYWAHFHFQNNDLFQSNQNIHLLKVSKEQNKVKMHITSAQDTLLRTSEMAEIKNAIAAINGTFFNTKSGNSVNFIKINGKIIDTTVINKNGNLYSQNQNAALAFIENDYTIRKRDTSKTGNWEELLSYDHVMESGPLLIYNFEKQELSNSPFNKNRHPRTCVCLKEDEIILLTVDGRNDLSKGLTLKELTLLMSWLGCKDAMNLDGGGSTSFYINTLKFKGIANMPCDNKLFDHQGERKVKNALLLLVEE